MKNTFDFLSGNVPGGIGLYILLLIVIFLVLFSISRRNELFNHRRFKISFSVVAAVLTIIYAGIWLSNPHPAVLSRYSTMFFAEDEPDLWLAYYFRDEITARLDPARSSSNYLYPQRWDYLANIDCAQPDSQCREIARKLPIEKTLAGEIKKKNGQYLLQFSIKNFRKNKTTPLGEVEFSPASPEQAVPAILAQIGSSFPVREKGINVSPADKDLALARDAFYRNEYPQSLQLCRRALERHPDDKEIRKWYSYNRIQLAKNSRLEEKNENPYDTRKSPWQISLSEARAFLINLFKENYDQGIGDVMLANMIGESFILEEHYGEAEEFLKIAYFENPFNVEVLQNLSLLHNSRYKELPFKNAEDILARILDICPLNEEILARYVEKLLADVPVNSVPSVKIRERIDRTLSLNPNSTTAWILEGRYNLMTFQYREALQDFAKADSLEPGKAVVQYNIGVAYYKLKQDPVAETYFKKAIQISDFLEAHLYLGVIYQDRGEYEKALEQFRYRVAHKQGDNDYYALQAMKGIRECLEALNIPIPQ